MAEREYIDTAQLFKCETCYHMGGNGKCNSDCDAGESYRPAFSKLKIADVVEVVRCKDCEFWRAMDDGFSFNNRGRTDGECEMLFERHYSERHLTGGEHFCSYGKRKEETT